MAEAVQQWDHTNAVPATGFDQLTGLGVIETTASQLRMGLELVTVVDLQNEYVEAEWSQTFGDELLHSIESVGLAAAHVESNPPRVLRLPILAPRIPAGGRSQR